MRRIFTIVLTLMLALAMQAQTTVSFMGVPVKGTPESFRQQLLMKGCYTDKNSVLKGVVDGALSTIIINESNNQVKSVTAIEDEQLANDQIAVARFNRLIDYYKGNPDYTEYESNSYIATGYPVTSQKHISEEWYYAEFFQTDPKQRYTKRMGFKLSDKYGGYRIVRHYDNNNNIDVILPE